MLERIREGSQGIVAKSVLGLVILTFAVSGIGSYINSQADTAVAKVNDVEIGQQAFESAYQNERARMEQQFGAMVEQLMADESYVANFRKGILDRLIVDELQKQNANDLGIRVGDEQINKAILEMEQFKIDGKFNQDTYVAILRQAGYTPTSFREYMRQQMASNQYAGAVFGTEFVLPSEEARFSKLNSQTRSFDMIEFDVNALKASITPEQSELESYFDANRLVYQTPEKVSVEYILMDSALIANDVQVSDEEVEDYYQANLVDYTKEEQRRLSHILVEAADDAADKIAQAKAKLDSGSDFAEVAKEFSTDTFSAENGGDLEWIERGFMGDQFDEAAFALTNVGDVTDVVETDFGFHIIKLTELVAEEVQPLAEVAQDIKDQIAKDKSAELYIEAQTKAIETAFEVPDTLEDAAQVAGLNVQTTEMLTRAELPGVLAQPQVANQLFNEEFIAEGINSDLIELSEDRSILVRVIEHKASEQQSLEEVKEAVTAIVVANKAEELVTEKAQQALEKVQAGEELSAQGVAVVRKDDVLRSDMSLDSNVRSTLFSLAKPIEGSAEYAVVNKTNGNAVVISFDKVGENTTAEANVSAQLRSLVNQISSQAYVEAMKANAEIVTSLN